jgi:hypothetical protein
MSIKKILKEIIAIHIAKTNIGQTVHFIIESEDKVYSWANTALEHLIKLEIIKESRYRHQWLTTIRKSFINISKQQWFKDGKQQNKTKFLMKVLNDFDTSYKQAQVDFNNSLIKNQSSFPKKYTYEQQTAVIAKWKLCVDKLLEYDLDFFNELDNHLE